MISSKVLDPCVNAKQFTIIAYNIESYSDSFPTLLLIKCIDIVLSKRVIG